VDKRYEPCFLKNVGLINRLILGQDTMGAGSGKVDELQGLGFGPNREGGDPNLEELRNKSVLMEDRVNVLKSKIDGLNALDVKSRKYLENYQKKLNCKVFTIKRMRGDAKRLEMEKSQIENFVKSLLANGQSGDDGDLIEAMDLETANLLGKRMDRATKKLVLACEKKKLQKKFKTFVDDFESRTAALQTEDPSAEQPCPLEDSENLLGKKHLGQLYQSMFNTEFSGECLHQKNISEIIPDGQLKDCLLNLNGEYMDVDPWMDAESEEFLYKSRKVLVTDQGVQMVHKVDKAISVQSLPFEPEQEQELADRGSAMVQENFFLKKAEPKNFIIEDDLQSNCCSNLTEDVYNKMDLEIDTVVESQSHNNTGHKSKRLASKSQKQKKRAALKNDTPFNPPRKGSMCSSDFKMNASDLLNLDHSNLKLAPCLLSHKKPASHTKNPNPKTSNPLHSMATEILPITHDLILASNIMNLQVNPRTPNKPSSRDKFLTENNLFDDHIFNLEKVDDDFEEMSMMQCDQEDMFYQGSLLNNLNLASVFDEETVINNLPNFVSPGSNCDDSIILARGGNQSFSFKKDENDINDFVPVEVTEFKTKDAGDKENARPYMSECQNKRAADNMSISSLLCGNLTIDNNMNKRKQR
jgi:hypothetical protein